VTDDRRVDAPALLAWLRQEAAALGFSQIGVAAVDLSEAEPGLLAWLAAGCHGEMGYMARHGSRRARPAELVPGTLSVITARMDYLPRPVAGGAPGAQAAGAATATTGDQAARSDAAEPTDWRRIEWARLADPAQATVSLYARGRDYHKTLRQRLQTLADRLQARVGPLGHRVFTDSAPLLEVELATRSGLGWRGKHTLALDREGGSMFFLGEICIDLALPHTPPVEAHCGSCSACIEVCPTQAITAPYRLDARRCISYLTIEHDGAIPVGLREAMGNRIYGCDDCQLVCPWNKFARRSTLADFDVRGPLGDARLLGLWAWTEADFLHHTEGSAIRRIGHARWQRNLAVALGNLLRSPNAAEPTKAQARAALAGARVAAGEVLREHIDWALAAAVTTASPTA
jgi:epoxyqueuosine reductase